MRAGCKSFCFNIQLSGFVLLPVAIIIVVLSCIALLINSQSAMQVNSTASQTEIAEVEYVAEAGMQHALWLSQNSSCAGDVTIATTALGSGSYNVTSTGGGTSSAYTLSVDQDAWIRSDDITKNNGATTDFHIRFETGKVEQPLVRFDLSTLPANAQINSAALWFYIEAGKEHSEGPVSIHKIISDWIEGEVTWDSFNASFDNTAIGMIPAQADSDVWVQVNITAQVQAWVNGEPNYGVLLNSVAEGIHAEYVSSEGASANHPRLEVIVGTSALTPLTLDVNGTLTNGVGRSLNRNNVYEFQPPSAEMLQPDPAESDDAEIYAQSPSNNYGDEAETWVSSASNDTTRSLLRFNMGAIPAGARILEANLSLLRQSGTGNNQPISAHRIKNSWSEGSVTWNNRKTFTNWDTPGGDFDNDAVATTSVGPGNQRYEWNITSLVQEWVDGSYPNYGVALVAGVSGMIGHQFYTSDDNNPSRRPSLSITYTCACGIVCVIPQGSGKIIMIGNWSVFSPNTNDLNKESIIESWGYDVDQADDDFIWAINFDNYDLVYISETAKSSSLTGQMDWRSIGVVNEQSELNSDLGFATGNNTSVGNSVDITDNSHYITIPFVLGRLPIYNAQMELVSTSGTLADGRQTLAEVGVTESLMLLDAGATTLIGPAAGKRVALMLGRSSSSNFNWDYLNNNGRLIVQRALQWGTGNIGPIVSDPIIFSTDSDAEIGGLKFKAEDLVEYDSSGDNATLIIDSSAAGMTNKIDAVHVLANNNIVLSTKDDTSFAGLSFKKEDLIEYNLTTDTASMYLEAEAHFDSKKNIISVHVLENGNVVLSTDGNATLGGLSFSDKDLVEYNRSTGNASIFFDGDATSLSKKISAVHILANRHIVLTADGDTKLGGLNFGPNQLVDYDPVADTATLYFNGGSLFVSSLEKLKSIHIGPGSGGESKSNTLPIAHWKLDENSGLTAEDSIGSHNGTLNNGPAWSLGQIDGALNFDGVNDAIRVAHDDTLSLVDGMTFSAWINASSFNTSYQTILAKDDGGTGSNYWFGTYEKELVFGFWSKSFFREVVATDLDIETGTWYHLAASFDNATDEVVLYLDGVQVQVGMLSFDPTVVIADLSIGRSPDGEYWPGLLDDIRIYDSVLSVADLAMLAAEKSGGGGGGGEPPGPSCAGTFLDEFNARSYSGSDGTLKWSTDWLEINESNGATSGDEQVRSDLGRNYVLRVRDNDSGGEGVQREADLSAYTSATLSFLYSRASLDNLNDYVSIEVSSNGGSTWDEIDRMEGDADDSDYLVFSQDISKFISSNTRIRFVSSSTLGPTDEVYFDNVQIEVSGCVE